MKTWYKAVCNECGEAIDLFVNNPTCTNYYLSKQSVQIQAWLIKHEGCAPLKLIWRDDQLDALWDMGYERQRRDDQCDGGFDVLVRRTKPKAAGEDWLRSGPCRCIIVDPSGMTLGRDQQGFVATCPPEVKTHVGKKGFAERMKPGEVRIILDDGTTLHGSECWWIKLEKGQ